MLDHGADVNLKVPSFTRPHVEVSVLRIAVGSVHLESVPILLSHGAVLEKELFEPLVVGFMDDELGVDTLQLFLNLGLDPNVTIPRGTPLQIAVRHGLLEKARALLLAGADQNVTTIAGLTPMDEAEKAGNEAIAELLRDARRSAA